jgi:hypothetical protein
MYYSTARLTAQHGIKLISPDELPRSHGNSLRVWLLRVHKHPWEEILIDYREPGRPTKPELKREED